MQWDLWSFIIGFGAGAFFFFFIMAIMAVGAAADEDMES